MLRSREALATVPTNPLSWYRSASVPWILALVASKAGDLATTIVGLTIVDGLSERNPVAGTVFHQFGVAGLCVVSVFVLVVVVLVVEFAGTVLERDDRTELSPDTAYFLGYFPLVTVFGGATVYNAVLICIRVWP
jgi:hypothetical protein